MEMFVFATVAAGILALIIAAVVAAQRRTEAQHVIREAVAEGKGWSYARNPDGVRGGIYRLGGTIPGGPEWTLTARRYSSGKSTVEETRWTVAVEDPGGAVAVGPPIPGMDMFGGMLLPLLIMAFFGKEYEELGGLEKVDVGPPGFQERFNVLATNQPLAQGFVDGPAEMALGDWAKTGLEPPIVLYWKAGLEIRIRRVIHDPDDLMAIVDLGLMLHASI